MKIISLVLCCAVSCFSNQILAQSIDTQTIPQSIREQYTQCIENNQHVEKNIKQCITDELSYQNRQLDEIYNHIVFMINKSQTKKLNVAQKAWLDRVNKDQNFKMSMHKNTDNELAQEYLYQVAQRVHFLTISGIFCCDLKPSKKIIFNHDDSYSNSPTPKGIRKEFIQCLKEAISGRPVLTCMQDEYNYQDPRINKLYKQLLSLLNPEQRKLLIVAQKSWTVQQNADEVFQTAIYDKPDMTSDGLFNNALVMADAGLYQMADRANWLANAISIVKNNGAQR